jgi:hypothetical protein
MFVEALNKATQGYMPHPPLRVGGLFSASLAGKVSVKFKEKGESDNTKYLLQHLVRLIHADPVLMLHVSIIDESLPQICIFPVWGFPIRKKKNITESSISF